MNGSRASSCELAAALASDAVIGAAADHAVAVAICPPSPFLADVHRIVEKSTIAVGAQNCHHRPNGAHTGDVSATMLRDVGCSFVIVGHSERRQDHKESDDLIAAKAIAALEAGLRPILCVGETLEQLQQQRTIEVVRAQLLAVARSLENSMAKVIVAYEPVWAIGTGLAASTDHVMAAHQAIAEALSSYAVGIPVLYGGSVTADNAPELFACPHVHGGLVGGASLQVSSFSAIVQAACLSTGVGH